MPRKPSRRTYIAKCDRLWSLIVRSKGYCENCGTTENLDGAHFIGRGCYRLRFDLRNGVSLCRPCHGRYGPRPAAWSEWFRTNRPEDYEYCLSLQWADGKRTLPEYEGLYLTLKAEYERVCVG